MSNQSKASRRQTILVDPPFQLRFGLTIGGAMLFYFGVLLAIPVLIPAVCSMVGAVPESVLTDMRARLSHGAVLFVPAVVLTGLFLFVHGALFSFRIAGPNYRFKQVFRGLAKLEVPRGVKIRQGDMLQDTAEELSQALGSLHQTLRAAQVKSQGAMERIHGEEKVSVEQLEADMAEICTMLSKFDLGVAAPGFPAVPDDVFGDVSETSPQDSDRRSRTLAEA